MVRVRVFSASFNPMYYDPKKVAELDFDGAKSFFENDYIHAAHCEEHVIDLRNPNELQLMQDGLKGGDTSDAMIVWIKVD